MNLESSRVELIGHEINGKAKGSLMEACSQ
jgi:hypothetical protein